MNQVVTVLIFYPRGFCTFDVSHALVTLMFMHLCYIDVQEGRDTCSSEKGDSLPHEAHAFTHTRRGV